MNNFKTYSFFIINGLKNNFILKIFIFISATAAIGSYMAIISWRKWPDILIDFGRELYVPWQLAQGAELYLDIAHFNGPFSAYINSLIFKIFGPSLTTIIFFNLFIISLITLLIVCIFRDIANNFVALVVAGAFLSLFAFSQYLIVGNFNFVTPYSHEIIHGILLSFLAIFSFLLFFKGKKETFWLANIGISLGLTFLTKPEVFIAIFISILIGFFWLILILRSPRLKIKKTFFILGLSFSFPIFIFGGYFAQNTPVEKAFFYLFSPYLYLLNSKLLSNPYYLWVSGMNAPLLNLKKLFISLGHILAGICLFIYLPSFVLAKLRNEKLKKLMEVFILLIIFFSIPYLLQSVQWLDLLRPLPLIPIGAIIFSSLKLRSSPKNSHDSPSILVFHIISWFSFLLILKIFLNTHIYHYGFALAMPATLLSIYIMLFPLTNKIGSKFGNPTFTQLCSIMLVGIFTYAHVDFSSSLYRLKKYKVGNNGDTILTWSPEISPEGKFFNHALTKIVEIIKKEENFIVLPEGVMLNYLTKRKNPTPYINFMPPELIIFGEDQIIAAFEKAAPDFILLVHKDTSVYGQECFGKDYGEKIYQWFKENYEPIYQMGNDPISNNGFGILITKRISK